MDYCERLRGLREDADKSQAEIATVLGTTQQYYGKYEAGKRPLPIDRLYVLCNYYGVSADYILGLPEGRPYGLSKTRNIGKSDKGNR